MIREIEEEGKRQRDGNPVAGTEKILSQNPYEPPTRKTKRSTKPMFHVASRQARDDLRQELGEYLARYWEASEALRGGNLEAANWFPEGCYPPALSFVGSPPPRTPSPPTRWIEILDSGAVERGEVPVVEISVAISAPRPWPGEVSPSCEPRARGQPP